MLRQQIEMGKESRPGFDQGGMKLQGGAAECHSEVARGQQVGQELPLLQVEVQMSEQNSTTHAQCAQVQLGAAPGEEGAMPPRRALQVGS